MGDIGGCRMDGADASVRVKSNPQPRDENKPVAQLLPRDVVLCEQMGRKQTLGQRLRRKVTTTLPITMLLALLMFLLLRPLPSCVCGLPS